MYNLHIISILYISSRFIDVICINRINSNASGILSNVTCELKTHLPYVAETLIR